MRILDVPAEELAACFIITAILTAAFFFPALSDFGHTLLGEEDVQFFIWLFWHYEKSLENGTNPLWAGEIFYPHGISLATSTITPLQGLLYVLLPAAWGVAGRMTFLQILTFVLGGTFSFALVRRYAGSFLPALAGSFLFNFSVFHFEKALHHLNYSMAMAFVPLFFLYYFAMAEDRKRNVAWLALALLLVALSEMTVAVMAGFIVAVDLFIRYAASSNTRIMTPRNAVVLCGSLVAVAVIFEALSYVELPIYIVYTVPAAAFAAIAVFAVLGLRNLVAAEKKEGLLAALALASLPTLLYLAVLASQSTGQFKASSVVMELTRYWVGIEYLALPSAFQEASAITGGLPAVSEAGVYLGPLALLLIALSIIARGAGKEEGHFRDLLILCVLFAFPLIYVGDTVVAVTPFFVEYIFPLLAFQRVPARFVMFALLFLSIVAGMLLSRLPALKRKEWLVLLLAAFIVIEHWPRMEPLQVEVPRFYALLAQSGAGAAIFLYPDNNYYTLVREEYLQTLHGKKLSYGAVSRFPEGNALFMLYLNDSAGPQDVLALLRMPQYRYDYVVVHKGACTTPEDCFQSRAPPVDAEKLAAITGALGREYGEPEYEDGTIIVYRTGKLRNIIAVQS